MRGNAERINRQILWDHSKANNLQLIFSRFYLIAILATQFQKINQWVIVA